jgi:FKBP-type peptidyl-prolyl cis-trans isomerase SlyD
MPRVAGVPRFPIACPAVVAAGSQRVAHHVSDAPHLPKGPMNVFANTVVTISFKLFDSNNQLIEEADEPIAYLHGGHSGIFPKVEEALNNKAVGDSVSVTLEPDDAFGDYDAQLMRIEPLDQLPPDVAVGGHLVAEQDGHEVVWRVTSIADGKAVLDGNHELAGQRLRFDCKVLDIRPATPEELTHGHVHGAHGHHH